MTVADAGGYKLKAEFGGITRELLQSSGSDDIMEMAQQITFKSLNLVYTDDSAVGRALTMTAKKLGANKDDVIALWLEEVRKGLAAAETPDTFNEMVIEAVTRFLNDPNTLAVSFNPPQPLPAGQLMGALMFGPASLIPALNISIAAE